jgi:hypothetical protein
MKPESLTIAFAIAAFLVLVYVIWAGVAHNPALAVPLAKVLGDFIISLIGSKK